VHAWPNCILHLENARNRRRISKTKAASSIEVDNLLKTVPNVVKTIINHPPNHHK